MSCRFSIDEYMSSAVALSRFSVSSFVVIYRAMSVASAHSRFASPFEMQLVPACSTTFDTLVMSVSRIVDGTAPGVDRTSTLPPASFDRPLGAKSLVMESPSIIVLPPGGVVAGDAVSVGAVASGAAA